MHRTFLVELYVPRRGERPAEVSAAARAGAEELAREGRHVRYVRSIYVPEDETCFLVYDGADVETVSRAATRAGIAYERVLPSEER